MEANPAGGTAAQSSSQPTATEGVKEPTGEIMRLSNQLEIIFAMFERYPAIRENLGKSIDSIITKHSRFSAELVERYGASQKRKHGEVELDDELMEVPHLEEAEKVIENPTAVVETMPVPATDAERLRLSEAVHKMNAALGEVQSKYDGHTEYSVKVEYEFAPKQLNRELIIRCNSQMDEVAEAVIVAMGFTQQRVWWFETQEEGVYVATKSAHGRPVITAHNTPINRLMPELGSSITLVYGGCLRFNLTATAVGKADVLHLPRIRCTSGVGVAPAEFAKTADYFTRNLKHHKHKEFDPAPINELLRGDKKVRAETLVKGIEQPLASTAGPAAGA